MIRIKRGINFGRKIILNTCFFSKKELFSNRRRKHL